MQNNAKNTSGKTHGIAMSSVAATSVTVAEFKIDYQQLVDEHGVLQAELPAYLQDKNLLVAMYKMLHQTRMFDAKAVALQRTGKLGTYPASLGQEAIGVAIGAMMQAEDVLCPYYRECAAQFWRGVKMEEILAFWGGDEAGSNFSDSKVKHDMPICIPIASQTLHAVGIATAIKYRQQPRAVVVVIGDGGTSRGDFYEAINVAGCWQLPVVFVVNNNQWAISVPRAEQTSAQTIAQKAIAAGIPGKQVDGNDVFAMSVALKEALAVAYAGGGATVIEALTYRICDHTTADDARRYRDEAEVNANKAKDPLLRFKKVLTDKYAWDEIQEQRILDECNHMVTQAVEVYFKRPDVKLTEMFDYLYADLPQAYAWQRQELQAVNTHDA